MLYHDNCVDTVLVSEVLEHVAEHQRVLAEARPVCVGVGCCWVRPVQPGSHADPHHDIYRYTETTLRRMLDGLEDVDVQNSTATTSALHPHAQHSLALVVASEPVDATAGSPERSSLPGGFTYVTRTPSGGARRVICAW